MSSLKDSLAKALNIVTKDFVREKRRAYRDQLSDEQFERLRKRAAAKREKEQIKAAAFKVMPQAYALASGDGMLPANARQIMYAARPLVFQLKVKPWKNSNYFTQTLLPAYQEEFPDECDGWDVVYDARGHFVEPHVEASVDIGTLDVRSYVNSWTGNIQAKIEAPEVSALFPTRGPQNRYKYALFIEKEGFTELLARAQIAERFDMAIFSSKGQSTTATRTLVDELSQAGVTIFLVHDFDRAGLLIAHYLSHDSKRYQFSVTPNVIDFGLRLTDVEEMGLQSEPVIYKQKKDPAEKFWEGDYDVTDEEVEFLIEQQQGKHWIGKRVELNAMTSRQFITWLEGKFRDQGVKKVIPDKETLDHAWKRARLIAKINAEIKQFTEKAAKDKPERAPSNLGKRIRTLLRKDPELPWDQALVEVAASGQAKR